MEPASYYQVHIETIPDSLEPLSNFLFELGATGVVEQEHSVLAYFPDHNQESELRASITRYLESLRYVLNSDFTIDINIENIKNRDWNAEWKKQWHALRISDTILIKPSWEPRPQHAPPVVIEIDPEMAFGSGEHSTTKLMLQLVEKHVNSKTTLLDVGTGTGILSIAALLLGANRAVGFDIDPIASKTAFKNAASNKVGERFLSYAGTLDALRDKQFDLIAANVNRSQIEAMLPRMRRHLKPGGICLLSGILDIENDIIQDACRSQNLYVHSVQKDKEWLAFETRSG